MNFQMNFQMNYQIPSISVHQMFIIIDYINDDFFLIPAYKSTNAYIYNTNKYHEER